MERITSQRWAPQYDDDVSLARRLGAIPLGEVLSQTADYYCTDPASFATERGQASSRDVAAWLARHVTVATLRELAHLWPEPS